MRWRQRPRKIRSSQKWQTREQGMVSALTPNQPGDVQGSNGWGPAPYDYKNKDISDIEDTARPPG